MSKAILDITNWRLPVDMIEYKKYLSMLRIKNRKMSSHFIVDQISPYDLYCYLKARFGLPNGAAMALRKPTSDNIVQWNYLVIAGAYFIDIIGFNTRTQIVLHGKSHFGKLELKKLISNIKADFKKHSTKLSEIRRSMEKWHLFVNPYKRLENIVNNLEKQLKELDIEKISLPSNPTTSKEMESFRVEMNNCIEVYTQAVGLGTSLTMIIPILGEAFINLIIFLCAKQEIKDDERLYQNTIRDQIDIRIKTLHLHCDGFSKPIDSNRNEFKDFHTLMNSRNDFLHGNIDPHKFMFDEVFFDNTIPLFKNNQNFAERALLNSLKFVEPQTVFKKLQIVRNFIKFILEHLKPSYRKHIELLMKTEQPGWKKDTKSVGILFSNHIVDFFCYDR